MRENLVFRSWFYFRQGWGTYFAFIIAAVNTMVTTYYLAIEKVEALQIIFPSFLVYVLFWIIIGIPLLVTIGYIHYKKSAAFSSEADISAEANPYFYKSLPGYNKEVIFPLHLLTINILVKLSKNENLNDEDHKNILGLQKSLQILIDGGYIGRPNKSKKDLV